MLMTFDDDSFNFGDGIIVMVTYYMEKLKFKNYVTKLLTDIN